MKNKTFLLIIILLSLSRYGFSQEDERFNYYTYANAYAILSLEESMGRELWASPEMTDVRYFTCSGNKFKGYEHSDFKEQYVNSWIIWIDNNYSIAISVSARITAGDEFAEASIVVLENGKVKGIEAGVYKKTDVENNANMNLQSFELNNGTTITIHHSEITSAFLPQVNCSFTKSYF
jgi:hypothetical protein